MRRVPAWSGWWSGATLVMVDLLVVLTIGIVAWTIKWWADPALPVAAYIQLAPAWLLLVCGYGAMGLYPGIGISPPEELRRLTIATSLFFLALAAATFVMRGAEVYSRQVFLMSWLGTVLLVPLVRTGVRRVISRSAWWGMPVLIVGAGRTGMQVAETLRHQPWLGLRPVAFADDAPTAPDVATGDDGRPGLPVLTDLAGGAQRAADAGVRYAVLAIPGLPSQRLGTVFDLLTDHFRHVYLAPAIPGVPGIVASTREFAQVLVLEIQANLLRPSARVIKRFLDLLLVLASAPFVVLFTLAMVLLIPLSSRGPVFYGQTRLGRDESHFTAWKFRTMVRDADAVLARWLLDHPGLRAEWERDHKLRDDPRVTWVGRFLRKTSLDELPQLWNILVGEMSLVGPRPIVDAEIPKYGEKFALYRKVRPGLTGLWQVSGRNDTTYEERVLLDTYYVRNWSVWLDIHIILRTVRVVLMGSGAY